MGKYILTRRMQFQSTSPVWGMTRNTLRKKQFCAISIHIPRVGDDAAVDADGTEIYISIHIPRVGDDVMSGRFANLSSHFNPHPPCGG